MHLLRALPINRRPGGGTPRTAFASAASSDSLTHESVNLDCLRSLAVLSVFFAHLSFTFGTKDIGPFRLGELGRLGVMMFFVHTSLVLMLSMERLKLEGMALFRSFLIRRAFRIYPLSMLFVVVTLTFHIPSTLWSTHDYAWPGWGNVISNLLLTQNLTYSDSVLGPMWSLPYEVQMYCLLPPIFLLLKRWPRVTTAAVLWVGAVLVALVQPKLAGRLDVAQFAPCFLSGVLAYALAPRSRRVFPASLWLVSILALTVGLSIAVDTRSGRPTGDWLYCLLVGLAVPFFKEIRNPVIKRISALIARYSYGIYLTHLVVFFIAFRAHGDRDPVYQWILMLVLIVAMPVACYHMIETPFIDSGKLIASEVRRRPGLDAAMAAG
jgi:peptidoglycan/LPS O-acetylase OafA/YrhL